MTTMQDQEPCPHMGCDRRDHHLHQDPYRLPPPDAASVTTAFAFAFDQLSQWLLANRDRL
jgi:hypothetical protein